MNRIMTPEDRVKLITSARHQALDEAIAKIGEAHEQSHSTGDTSYGAAEYRAGLRAAKHILRTLRDTPPPRSDRDE